MKRSLVYILASVAAVALLTIGYIAGERGGERRAAPAAQRTVLYWFDPMTPEQHFNHPGLSPMGMQMVPKYAESTAASPASVRIDPAVTQSLGVRTTVVKVAALRRDLRVSGTVGWDLRRARNVSARVDGLIAALYVRAPFTTVKKGQPLASMIAPRWAAAAQEYFALRDARSSDARALRAAAHARLEALGMDAAQIRHLRSGSAKIVLRAPITGVISTMNVREGDQVTAGTLLMTVNGLGAVWLNAAIPQAQAAGITAGTPVRARVSAMPGRTFHGRIEALLPDVDSVTRTQQARIVIENPDHRLAPGMFAELAIQGAADAAHPLVPDGALIGAGARTRVIIAGSGGEFTPVSVRTGASSGGMTEILAGLRGGERIVSAGQFLIDSEASLSGALERLAAPGTPTAPGTKR